MSDLKQPKNVLHVFKEKRDWETIYAIFTNQSTWIRDRIFWYYISFCVSEDEVSNDCVDDEGKVYNAGTLGYYGTEITWASLPELVKEIAAEVLENPTYA